jgi:hypothetical protein
MLVVDGSSRFARRRLKPKRFVRDWLAEAIASRRT